MNAIINTPVSMTSRELAELTGKQHSNVMRDIRNMIDSFEADSNLNWHCESDSYIDSQGKVREMYRLDKNTTLCLVSGYEPVLRMRIIQRLDDLDQGKLSTPSINYDAAKVTAQLAPLYIDMAKAFGFEGNQALLCADNAIRNTTGLSPLALMEHTLIAPVKAQTYTPTELGMMMEPVLSARKVNKLLQEKGLQTLAHRGKWEPTEPGRCHCEVLDTSKRHSNGTPIKQVKWYGSVMGLISGYLIPLAQSHRLGNAQ